MRVGPENLPRPMRCRPLLDGWTLQPCHRLKEAEGAQRPMATPSSSPPPAASASASASRLEIVLFFFSGLGSSLCYIATLSSLVFYKSAYGAQSYIYINLAVFLPLLPVAIAQARYDQGVDRLVGSANAFLCRGIVGHVLSNVKEYRSIDNVNPSGPFWVVFGRKGCRFLDELTIRELSKLCYMCGRHVELSQFGQKEERQRSRPASPHDAFHHLSLCASANHPYHISYTY